MPVSTKFKPSQERFHGKLPSRSVVDGSCTIDSKNELPLINVQAALKPVLWSGGVEPHQVRKPGKSAPGGSYQRMWILSNTSFKAFYKTIAESTESTRCEIGGKVRLVGVGLSI